MEKRFDLEERTENFALAVIKACKTIPKSTENIELVSQAVRAAGSVGANYIEANEAISKKDFAYRIRICRKESKECRYWLKLMSVTNPDGDTIFQALVQESTELMNIFGAILKKSA